MAIAFLAVMDFISASAGVSFRFFAIGALTFDSEVCELARFSVLGLDSSAGMVRVELTSWAGDEKNEQNFVTARFEASHKLLLQEYDKRLPLTGNGTVIPDIAGCKTVSN